MKSFKSFKSEIEESVEQIDEISDNLKRRYLDKVVQTQYDKFNELTKLEHLTPSGKRLKKSWLNSLERKKASDKFNRRGATIDKVAKDVTGKPHYSKMSTLKSPAVRGNADDWWKGKKYVKEEAPANATTAVPGAGDDNSLHMKKMRMWKAIHRRHRLPGADSKK